MTMPKIESGIGIPATKQPQGKWRELSDKMKHGDSVMFDDRREAMSFANHLDWNRGCKAVRRTVYENNKAIGMRVWKVKK